MSDNVTIDTIKKEGEISKLNNNNNDNPIKSSSSSSTSISSSTATTNTNTTTTSPSSINNKTQKKIIDSCNNNNNNDISKSVSLPAKRKEKLQQMLWHCSMGAKGENVEIEKIN